MSTINGLLHTLRVRPTAVLVSSILLVAVTGCAPTSEQESTPITFKDIAPESGINATHISSDEKRYIVESMSGGAAVFDCNADGLLDIVVVNGSTVDRFKEGGDLFVTLYRQAAPAGNGEPKFENVTDSAGLGRKGFGMGVTAVDFDADGHLDLFVTGFKGNAVYKGKGGCVFEDFTDASGLKGGGFDTGAAWADYDRDGDLDVFVPGYVYLDLEELPVFGSAPTCRFMEIDVQCGPRGLKGEPDRLYRNKGDGTFEDVSAEAGVADEDEFYGLGAVWGDLDNDGWPDLYVANDSHPNYLYRNNQDGTFEDVSFESGTSYSGAGAEQGSMGVAIGDYDGDGSLDIFITNFDGEVNTLYRNLGEKGFTDVSRDSNTGPPGTPYTGWGTGFFDPDNDGLPDLLVLNGHVYPQVDSAKSEGQPGFRQAFLLHRNLGNGRFEDVTVGSGLDKIELRSRRGAAFGDLNNDGLIDVVVTNLGEQPNILLNITQNRNRGVTFQLEGVGKNLGEVGARVILKTDKRTLIQEVQAGSSYLSQNDLRLHFGLAEDETIAGVEVRWSNGKTEKIDGVEAGKITTVREGKGVVGSKPYAGT
ncbi:MAG TPA: CRTAC1 family protein [Aridibacter sp.]|nr:CRTAC1 family protein [Aridibacter sp.]